MESLANRLQNLSSRTRLVWAIGLAILVFLTLPSTLQISTRLLSAWCAGAGCFLLLVMVMMRSATAAVTRDRSQRYGASAWATVGFPSVAAGISILAISFLVSLSKEASTLTTAVHLGLSTLAIACSWFLIPVTFARRYATLYYQPKPDEGNWDSELAWARGLDFVEEETPTYWDFLYFAFILGATAQTADTMIVSRSMRRLALVQCLTAFFFFVGVFAMTVNIGSGVLAAAHN